MKSILPALFLALFPAVFYAQNPCDTVTVVAQATATNLTCDNPVATLTGALHPSALSYHWSGPGGFSSNNRVAQNFVKGTYTLTVTGALGCTAQTSVTVSDLCTGYPLDPPACAPPYEDVVPAEDCWTACVMPYLPENVLYHTWLYAQGPAPAGWCGTIENDQWFAFVAGATSGSITATPLNCANGDGIQIGLYSDCPASNLIACNGGGSGYGDVPVTIDLVNLNIGQVYYLIVDGYAGDQCDFLFESTHGVCNAPPLDSVPPPLTVVGDSLVCPGAYADYQVLNLNSSASTAFLWTAPQGSIINGIDNPLLIYKPDGESVWVQFGTQSGFVCMRQIYYFYPPSPPVCFPVENNPIPVVILPPVIVCNEDAPYTLPWGDEVYASGIYQITLESWQGCDSIIKQQVIIKPPIFKNLGTIYRCTGECFDIGGESYCENGVFAVVLESYQGCDSTVTFNLIFASPVAEILGGGTLTCVQTTVTLSSAPSNGVKTWKNAAGQILGAGNTFNATQPGLYILTTTQTFNGTSCQQSDTILIGQDVTTVIATAQSDTITCATPLATLSGSASDPQATLSWSGPNGFTAYGPEALASLPGNYYLLAVSANGCSDTELVVVTADQGLPVVDANGGQLSCFQPSIQLQYSCSDPDAVFTLLAPDGEVLSGPTVSVPGQYTVIATSANGCSVAAFAQVLSDQEPPIAVAGGGTLTCIDSTVTLQSNSNVPLISLEWTGPNGFVSVDPIPSVDQPGIYTLTVVSGNGCQGSASAQVFADQDAPPLSLSADVVNCDPGNEAHVYAAPPLANLSYSWTGPDNFAAYEPAPVVTTPGWYAVTVVNPASGCTAESGIEVTGSVDLPDLDVTQIVPNCGDTLLYLDAASSTPNVQFHWTGPDGFTSGEEDPVVTTPGWYKVTAFTNNACEASINILVVAAPTIPQVSISGGSWNCTQLNVPLQVSCNLPVDSYEWTGPGNFTSQEAGPLAPSPGVYFLTLTADNGCTAVASTTVGLDIAVPDVSATGGVLTCAQPVATITATSSAPGVVLSWMGAGTNFPEGQAAVQVAEPGTYWVVATAPNGCTSTAAVTVVDSCISAQHEAERLHSSIRLYPNASSGVVFVEALHTGGLDALRVYAADGRLIWSADFETPQALQRLDLTEAPTGTYAVLARIGARWFTEQLILMR